MKNKKAWVINISMAFVAVMTLMECILNVLPLYAKTKTMQSGAEIGFTYISIAMTVGIFLALMALEVSLYFNVRYFVLEQNKKLTYTLLNAGMVVAAVYLIVMLVLVYYHFPVANLKYSIWIMLAAFLALIFMRYGYGLRKL